MDNLSDFGSLVELIEAILTNDVAQYSWRKQRRQHESRTRRFVVASHISRQDVLKKATAVQDDEGIP